MKRAKQFVTNFALGFVDESQESHENRRSGRSLAVLASCPREPRGLWDLWDYLRSRQSPRLRKCNMRTVSTYSQSGGKMRSEIESGFS